MIKRYLFEEKRFSPQEEEYLEKKIDKLATLFPNVQKDDELQIEVDIARDRRGFYRLEIMIKTPHKLYRVDKIRATFTEAVNEVEDALVNQIKNDKQKQITIKRKGSRILKQTLLKSD